MKSHFGALALLGLAIASRPAWAATKCTWRYSLAGWSALYSTASGSWTATCDNGRSSRVSLLTKGGGLTAGKSRVTDGSGTFSEVADISELFGKYAVTEVHADVVGSSAAQVVTKGTVSLASSGTGKGVDLSFTFGEFVIQW